MGESSNRVASAACAAVLLFTGNAHAETPASVYCAEAGNGGVPARRVLVLGESWASRGRLLPALPHQLAKRLGKRVRVCSIGFSGKNSQKVLALRSAALERRALRGQPDNVLILLGVNDQIQHRGADFYGRNVAQLVNSFPGSRVQAVSAPIVSNDPPLTFFQRLKNKAAGLLNRDEHAAYVRALKTNVGAERVIDFSRFSSGYYGDRRRFAADGIHLTTPAYTEYGRFLGEQISLTR